jgi:hypothetical protein
MSQEEFQSRVLMSNTPPPPTEKPYRGPKYEGFTVQSFIFIFIFSQSRCSIMI